jgi:hypothetical protein
VRWGRTVASAAVLLASLFPASIELAPACAGESARAALVVDTGESVHRFCVVLSDAEVSGLELIELAGEQHGLSYRFGFGGDAVCMLAGVGPGGDDCFEDYPDFWGYWRGDGSGGWGWSSSGAGSTTVGDGDVEGWSWGSGSNGESHPPPPPTEFPSVCEVAPAPAPRRQKEGTAPRAESDDAPGTASGDRTLETAIPRERPHADEKPGGSAPRGDSGSDGKHALGARGRAPLGRPSPTDIPDPTVEELAAPAADGPPDAGPPPVGLAALGAAAILGTAGFLFSRGRGARRR